MPSQAEVRKRRVRAEARPDSGGTGRGSRRDRRRRLMVGIVAIVVVTMMVASLAVGLIA